MPIIVVRQASGRGLEEKRAAIRGITAAVCSAYGVPAEQVTVIFSEMDPQNFGKGGQLNFDRQFGTTPVIDSR